MNNAILNSLPVPIAVLNVDLGQVVSVNSSFSALFEMQTEDHIPWSMGDLTALLGDELTKLIRGKSGILKKEIKVGRKRCSYVIYNN